ncbi:hypothetical protein HYV80_03660 [Candidatus Woesearchaeota archaeon]|nr:hypothetical protein [Candidatus Woesearchaeota archaeon]
MAYVKSAKKLGFNSEGGLIVVTKEKRDWSGIRSTDTIYSKTDPWSEQTTRDYFEKNGVSKKVFDETILPLLADRASLDYPNPLHYKPR